MKPISNTPSPRPKIREWVIKVEIDYDKFLTEGEDPVDVYSKLGKIPSLSKDGITFMSCHPTNNSR